MTLLRLAPLALVSLCAAACTPAVGLSKNETRPSAGKAVMVLPTAEAMRGSEGERIELSAWGFTRSGNARVWFGATAATEVEVVDGWRLAVVVPKGTGLVDVCVENGAGAWVMLEAFRYPTGTSVERCWPAGASVASVNSARERIAEVRGSHSPAIRVASANGR